MISVTSSVTVGHGVGSLEVVMVWWLLTDGRLTVSRYQWVEVKMRSRRQFQRAAKLLLTFTALEGHIPPRHSLLNPSRNVRVQGVSVMAESA